MGEVSLLVVMSVFYWSDSHNWVKAPCNSSCRSVIGTKQEKELDYYCWKQSSNIPRLSTNIGLYSNETNSLSSRYWYCVFFFFFWKHTVCPDEGHHALGVLQSCSLTICDPRAALVQLCWKKPRCSCLSTLPRQMLGGAWPLQPHPLGYSRWLTCKPGREAGEVINLPGHLTNCSSLFAFFVCLLDASFLMFELKELLEKSHPSQGAADRHKQENSHCWQWKAFPEMSVFSSLESSLLVPAHALCQPALIYSTMLYGEVILDQIPLPSLSHEHGDAASSCSHPKAVKARLRTMFRSMLELEKGWVVPFARHSVCICSRLQDSTAWYQICQWMSVNA